MELFQELLFTLSLSLIVSLLMAKLFSMASDCDDSESNPLTESKFVVLEEKTDKEWVVCDSETEEKVGYFEDAVKVNDHEEEELRVGEIDKKTVFDEVEVGGLREKGMDESFCKGECENEKRTSVGEGKFAENVVDVCKIESQSVEESPERENFQQIEIGLVKSNEIMVVKDETNMGNYSDEVNIEEEEDCFDDWEGIERTELEKGFGAAVAFVGSKSNADRISLLDNEVKMQFYGLHKVAIEGPCREPQPMAIKVSARANWNAWKRLGNASPEDAMQQYIALLSQNIPDWMGNDNSEDSKIPSYLEMQPGAEKETERRTEQLKPDTEECVIRGVEDPNIINRDKQ